MLLGKQVAIGHTTIDRNTCQFLPPLVSDVIVCVAINEALLDGIVILILSFNRKCEGGVSSSQESVSSLCSFSFSKSSTGQNSGRVNVVHVLPRLTS